MYLWVGHIFRENQYNVATQNWGEKHTENAVISNAYVSAKVLGVYSF
jgi:hypothetical protein